MIDHAPSSTVPGSSPVSSPRAPAVSAAYRMDYRALILEGYAERRSGPRSSPRFFPGATEAELARMAAALPFEPPADLLALLRQTNGVLDTFEVSPGKTPSVVENLWLVWPVELLVAENEAAGELLRFAPAGVDGITYVLQRHRQDVAAWCPLLRRELVPVADSLESYSRRSAAGAIAL